MHLRISLLVASLLVLTSVPVIAQANFPVPAYVLTDTKNKNKESGVNITGNQITIMSGVGTPTSINAIAFSDDGKLVAAAKDFGRVVVWQTDTRAPLKVFDTKQQIVQAIGFSPDGKMIATAGSEHDPALKFWSVETGKLLNKFPLTRGNVRHLAFISNDSLIVNENGPVYVLDVKSGQHLFDQPDGEGLTILSEGRKELVSAKGDEFLIRALPGGSITHSLPRPAKNAWPLAYSQKDGLLIFGTFFDKPGFHILKTSHQDSESAAEAKTLPQFNPSAGYFAAIDERTHIVWLHSDAKVWAWDPTTNKTCSSAVLYSESGQISTSAGLVASGNSDGILSKSAFPSGVAIWRMDDILRDCALR